jgi:NTP pyrophosphatase (non-canonical NTP hydrolase)
MSETQVTLAEEFNNLASTVFEASASNGFWKIDEISDFAIVPIKLALIGDEVSEALKVHREEFADTLENDNNMTAEQEYQFTEELADIVIRTLDLAGGLGLYIGESIMEKIEKNKDRPYRHGKRY